MWCQVTRFRVLNDNIHAKPAMHSVFAGGGWGTAPLAPPWLRPFTLHIYVDSIYRELSRASRQGVARSSTCCFSAGEGQNAKSGILPPLPCRKQHDMTAGWKQDKRSNSTINTIVITVFLPSSFVSSYHVATYHAAARAKIIQRALEAGCCSYSDSPRAGGVYWVSSGVAGWHDVLIARGRCQLLTSTAPCNHTTSVHRQQNTLKTLTHTPF